MPSLATVASDALASLEQAPRIEHAMRRNLAVETRQRKLLRPAEKFSGEGSCGDAG